MSEILIAFSTWLHALATVVFIGHFVLLALVYLPAVKEQADIPAGPILGLFSKRGRAMDRFRLYSNGMPITGVLVVLLTALSQVK